VRKPTFRVRSKPLVELLKRPRETDLSRGFPFCYPSTEPDRRRLPKATVARQLLISRRTVIRYAQQGLITEDRKGRVRPQEVALIALCVPVRHGGWWKHRGVGGKADGERRRRYEEMSLSGHSRLRHAPACTDFTDSRRAALLAALGLREWPALPVSAFPRRSEPT
jgi:hypothetical protein